MEKSLVGSEVKVILPTGFVSITLKGENTERGFEVSCIVAGADREIDISVVDIETSAPVWCITRNNVEPGCYDIAYDYMIQLLERGYLNVAADSKKTFPATTFGFGNPICPFSS